MSLFRAPSAFRHRWVATTGSKTRTSNLPLHRASINASSMGFVIPVPAFVCSATMISVSRCRGKSEKVVSQRRKHNRPAERPVPPTPRPRRRNTDRRKVSYSELLIDDDLKGMMRPTADHGNGACLSGSECSSRLREM